MKIPQPRTVPDIVKHFYSVISRPVRYASLFYTLYYLVEVENIRELRRDFEKIRDELWVAFYNYGIYSVGREMMHFSNKFRICEQTVSFDRLLPETCLTLNSWLLSLDKDAATRVAYNHLKNPLYTNYIETAMAWNEGGFYTDTKSYKAVEGFCLWIEKNLLAFSNNKRFLNNCQSIFVLDGWLREYGGESWAKICKTLIRRKSTKPTIFVDACWNIQHNSGFWMDKVKVINSEKEFVDEGELTRILDSNLLGKMIIGFDYAVTYEPSLIKYKEYIK